MVEVQEGGLSAFEQDSFAGVQCLVQPAHGVGDVRHQPGRDLTDELVCELVGIDSGMVVHALEITVAVRQHRSESLAQRLGLCQILNAQSDPRRLVGVCRSDAALGRAQLRIAALRLGQLVGDLVVRQHEVCRWAQHQPAAVHAPPGEHVDFVDEYPGVDNHSVADDRCHMLVEHPAGNELECERLAVDDQRVTGVVTALVAHDVLAFLGDYVDDTAFAFIAPLGAYDDGTGHRLPR